MANNCAKLYRNPSVNAGVMRWTRPDGNRCGGTPYGRTNRQRQKNIPIAHRRGIITEILEDVTVWYDDYVEDDETKARTVLTLSQKTNSREFSKLKEFADDNFRFDENGRKLLKWVENTVGKGEIARYEQFLLFPQSF